MSGEHFRATAGPRPFDDLDEITDGLRRAHERLVGVSNEELLGVLADFGSRLLRDPSTRGLDGAMFLSAWLKRTNLESMLDLNLGGRAAALEDFLPLAEGDRAARLRARPHGLVSMWMAGNVPTLAAFSFVPALLARNVCLVKLADPEDGMDAILNVLAESSGPGISGAELAECVAIVWYSSAERGLSEQMSRAADAKVVWGGREAINGVRRLPQADHCVNIEFGPKYSIGVIGRQVLEDSDALDDAVGAFVRDIAVFDQRACSSPQTVSSSEAGVTLGEVGERFAAAFERLPPKPDLDAYTTMQILNARAEWALDQDRDVLASDGANWTVCMDTNVSLKEAVQSRTVFLTSVESWEEIVPLLTPGVQTVGIAFGEVATAEAFAAAATLRGVARCVRPGLMNVQESPWDGKLLVNQLVRWVTLKP